MSGGVLELRAGVRIWFDGRAFTVCQVNPTTVRLQSGDGDYRTATIEDLLTSATALGDSPQGGPEIPAAVVLASLTGEQRAALDRQVDLLAPLLAAADGGLGGGPRAADRMRQVANQLGVTVRTVQRRLARLAELGPAGLVDQRLLKDVRRTVDPRWDAACLAVLADYADASTPSKNTVIRRATATFLQEVPDGRAPTRATGYRRLAELDHGRYTFGEAKQRRSVARRPKGVLGQLQPRRPGEYVLLDGNRLDVFAMEPVTMRWVNTELTVALDLYDRSVKGIRLRPVAAKSADVASVLGQCLTPQRWGSGSDAPTGPYTGVPEHVVLGSAPVLPDTIVIDHGKVYMSAHTMSVCRRLGISIQPAIPHKPTDKPALERFFRTLRLSLLDKLPGYKGPNVASRGKDIESGAFYYVTELEQLIRAWVGDVYHRTAHHGLLDPLLPHVELSPEEMFNRGIAISGLLRLPAAADLRYELMQVCWRQIHHYGVDIDGRRYDGPALNRYRGRRSGYGGAHPGSWPILLDVDDVRTAYFQDPTDKTWHELAWRAAAGIGAPFSADAADYTRRVSILEQRHVDPAQAVDDLLARWSKGEVTDRRERNLAIRLAAQPATDTDEVEGESVEDRASLPGVIDLLTRRTDREPAGRGHPDDLQDVFDAYYRNHPDGGMEVIDP